VSAGPTLGPYRLVRRLALGGMAEIFLARREGPEGFARDLVVKRILPHLAADGAFVQMFLDEARLAAQLHHPNVVHVYDFGEADESYYLAMELIRGVDLRALIDRAAAVAERGGAPGGMPPHHAAKIGSFVCEGLAHAHAKGAVHRDVTPSNVLLSFDGAVKLADFGIAKAEQDLERRESTGHGVVKGKHAYLSPEQARGERLDARSDLFNVGILLFEGLLGEPLYPQEDRRKAKWLAAKGRVPGLERLGRVPEPLAEVVRRALAPRPDDRYPDALALRADLEAFLRAWPEPSDAVELGRYVRALFPDVLEDETPRAAGTVPATAALTAAAPPPVGVPLAPAPAEPTTEPTERTGPTTEPLGPATEPTGPTTERRSRSGPAAAWRRRRALGWALGGVGLLAAVGALAFALWPEAPPRTPPRDPPGPVQLPTDEGPAPAQLRIRSEPPGAAIRVDGIERGTAPVVLEVEAGRAHAVEARTPDDSIAGREEVVLAAGEVREVIFEAAEPPRARLRVLSSPGGATVRLGDAVVGTTPLEAQVPPGRHTVRVRLDGYEPAQDEVEVAGPRETATLSFALTPTEARSARAPPEPAPERGTGTLTIATTPWSEVYLGGRHLGTTPLANVRLPAGRHVLSLRHPGRPPRRVPIRIRPGRDTRVRLAL
jgi:serine/threonine-protein kinase